MTVARLATVTCRAGSPAPHIVPLCFALLAPDTIVSAIDHKPKRTLKLERLANIAANPQVSVLADRYCDDWNALWWVRADGRARVLERDEQPMLRSRALDALAARYRQYAQHRPEGPLVVVEVDRWSGWAASG